MHRTKVAVIIVNYKTSHLIQKLVTTISESRVDVSIWIVDNASTEASYAGLAAINDPRLRIIRSGQNLGFTGGINFGLRYLLAHEPGVPYFFLLNPDAFSAPELIGDLVQILEKQKNTAAVSPQVLHVNGEPWYTGGVINYKKGRVMNYSAAASGVYPVDVFSGCAVLFDLKKVVEVGMFNEDLFMYFDEAELSIRLQQKGYKILCSPHHKILHDVSYTTRKISHLKTYYMTRNKFMVFHRDMNLYQKTCFLVHELAFYVKHRRLKNAYYHIVGFVDFLKGKKGPLTTR